MINKRINAIKAEANEIKKREIIIEGAGLETSQRLFHHSKKATKLLLSESDLKELKNQQDYKRCVIL